MEARLSDAGAILPVPGDTGARADHRRGGSPDYRQTQRGLPGPSQSECNHREYRKFFVHGEVRDPGGLSGLTLKKCGRGRSPRASVQSVEVAG